MKGSPLELFDDDVLRRVAAGLDRCGAEEGGAVLVGRAEALNQRFTIERVLGEGATSIVHAAYDHDLERAVALKLWKRDVARVDTGRRFEREVIALTKLDHPNIVEVLDHGRTDHGPFLVMKRIDGGSLTWFVDREARDPAELVRVVRDAALGVAEAHRLGITHRDLKPENVLVDRQGHVRVCDFGLARLEEQPSEADEKKLVGTLGYMAPEQVDPSLGAIGPATDVWALAALLGRGLGRMGAAVPAGLRPVLHKSLRRGLGARYENASELALDLDRYLQGRTTNAAREVAWRRARRTAVWISSLIALAVVVLVLSSHREHEKRESSRRLAQSFSDRAEGYFGAAMALRRAGDRRAMQAYVSKAEADCRRAIAEGPDDPAPHFVLGRVLRVSGRLAEARRQLATALALDGDHLDARRELGLLIVESSHRLEDEIWLDWSRGELFPAASGWFRIQRQRRAGRGLHASTELATLRSSVRPHLPAMRGLGRAVQAWWQDKPEAAAAHLAPEVHCGDPDVETLALGWLARIAEERSDFAAATAWYSKGIQQDRGYAPFRVGRARAHLAAIIDRRREKQLPAAEYAAVVDDLEAALRLAPLEATHHDRLGQALLYGAYMVRTRAYSNAPFEVEEGVTLALAAFDRALELAPSLASSLFGRGIAWLEASQVVRERGEDGTPLFERADRDFRSAIEQEPRHRGMHAFRARMLFRRLGYARSRGEPTGDLEEAALAACDDALRLDDQHFLNWRTRGQVLLAAGRLAEARDALERATQLGGAQDRLVRTTLARCRRRIERGR